MRKLDLEDELNLISLHEAAIEIMKSLPLNTNSRVLEVGPARQTGANNSGFWSRHPELFFDFEKFCRYSGAAYSSLDLDPGVGATYVGALEATESSVPKAEFSIVLASSVLEHIPDLSGAIRTVANALIPGGLFVSITPWDLRFHGPRPDCWRISDDGYRFLLKNDFDSLKFRYIKNPSRPLSPFGIAVTARKKLECNSDVE